MPAHLKTQGTRTVVIPTAAIPTAARMPGSMRGDRLDAGRDGGTDEDAGEPDAGLPDSGVEADGGADPLDAGEEEDAGPADAGLYCPEFNLPEPSPPLQSNAGVGQPCNPWIGGLTNCAPGLRCQAFFPGRLAFCTEFCANDEVGCGPDQAGKCAFGTPSFCLAACDGTTACPLNQVCSHEHCIPDCRLEPPTYCTIQWGDHSLCDGATGLCETKRCAGNADCPANAVCDTTVSPPACVPDCNAEPGYCCHLEEPGLPQACHASTGLCDPGPPFISGYGLRLKPTGPVDPVDAGEPPPPADGGELPGPWDAGPPPDCSPYDGGVIPAIVIRPQGQLGELCEPFALIEDHVQGSCADGLLCGGLPKSGAAFCYSLCEDHSDCGFTGTLPNICGGNHPNHRGCLQACDDAHPCPTQMACQPMHMADRQVQVCLPDCRLAWDPYCHTAILENTHCDQSTGVCRVYDCDHCPAGTICDTTRTPNVCRIDCRTQPPNFCCQLLRDEGPLCVEETGLCKYWDRPPSTEPCETDRDCGPTRMCHEHLCFPP